MRLLMENVRCFYGKHEIPIKPLTFFVGENSSGKTTALAMLAAANDMDVYQLHPDFNVPPFDLGSYDTIVSRRHGNKTECNQFGLGFVNENAEEGQLTRLHATFQERSGQPELVSIESDISGLSLGLRIDDSEPGVRRITGLLKGPSRSKGKSLSSELQVEIPEDMPILYGVLSGFMRASSEAGMMRAVLPADFRIAFHRAYRSVRRPTAIAPIRTKPKRIYETRIPPAPEGDHIPFVLAQSGEGDEKRAKALSAMIREFGRDSGLFRAVHTKRLGRKPAGPFRLMINIGGLETNISDVGYGVSQILPLLVESILNDETQQILLQQPEVHLHAHAQAALGTFLCKLVAKKAKKFVVETHSDYILDRVRQEVAKGTVSHKDVAIIYFEKKGVEATVHPIELDDVGNILNAPRGYRQFFLEEELNLMTGGGR